MRLSDKNAIGMSVSMQKFHRNSLCDKQLPELNVRSLYSGAKRKSTVNKDILKFYVNDLQCVIYDDLHKRKSHNSEYIFVDSYLDVLNYIPPETPVEQPIESKQPEEAQKEITQTMVQKQLPSVRVRVQKKNQLQLSMPPKRAMPQRQQSQSRLKELLPSVRNSFHIQQPRGISAKKWCVFVKYNKDAKFNKVMGVQDDKRCEMASITKIMTCYTSLLFFNDHQIDPDNIRIKIPAHAEDMDGTSAYLNAGGILTARQLMYAMMLPSGNDAALVLSISVAVLMQASIQSRLLYSRYKNGTLIDCERHLEQSRKELKIVFLEAMNNNCKRLHMEGTNYNSVHGMNDPLNQSTAINIALLVQECIKLDSFMEVVGTKTFKTNALTEKGEKCTYYKWKNTNKLLKKGWHGIKTGVTTNAGPCFAGYFKNDQFEAIVVILNCQSMDQRWRDAEQLIKCVKCL